MDLEKLKNLDFSSIDWNDMGNWPFAGRLVVFIVLAVVVIGAGYHYIISPELVILDRVEQEEQGLRQEFAAKQRRAANLDAYRKQLEEMRVSFGAMLRQLPGETEVPNLLIDISQAGLAAGLEQELFQPQPEQPKEFYAELPINIRLTGDFHQLGQFASRVAALARIVTLHEISIQPVGQDSSNLRMEVIAKTYRYLDETEGG